MHKSEDRAKWPGHVRASIREDVLSAKLGEFLHQHVLGYDRAVRLAELADPRIDDDTAATPQTETGNPATSPNTFVDVSRTAIGPRFLH